MENREKTILIIAFHFPPAAMSSGHLRTLGFVKYLPSFDWNPVVLSAHARAYPRIDATSEELIPQGCLVHRAFALDARRHFGIRGKYPDFLAQPDRWSSWWPVAVWQGLRLIRKYNIRVIWSTYPIMTSHCIAYTLSRLTGLPWIAEFRDPVSSSVATQSRLTASIQMRCEHRVVSNATHSVFTAPSAMQSYTKSYPQIYREGRMAVIPNGYDEDDFPLNTDTRAHPLGRPLWLLHSGLLYPNGRTPVPFFMALAKLKASGVIKADLIRITLRASGSEAIYKDEIKRLGLEDIVVLAPPISHRQALIEQTDADALLLFQGSEYDNQIPAKLYEYLRIGRPIFALVGEQGDTAALLRYSGGAEIVPLHDVDAIEVRLTQFISALREGRGPKGNAIIVQRYSRRAGVASLAGILDKVSSRN